MKCVDSHWESFYVLGTITRFGEVFGLNLFDKDRHCDWLLQIRVRAILHQERRLIHKNRC